MRIIGVIDLRGGLAVHARAGRRESYAPVAQVAGEAIPAGDAVALARGYVDRCGLTELYVADLDAIAGGAPHDAQIAAIAQLGADVWVDAGVSSAAAARRVLDLGAAVVVVGLETLTSFDTLASICRTVGGRRVAFSLDLRDGTPILASHAAIARDATASRLAADAAAAGAGIVIVLDLARVGVGAGVDTTLLGRVRAAAPGVSLFAGGGVRGIEDLKRVEEAGCDGALVATALQRSALKPDQSVTR